MATMRQIRQRIRVARNIQKITQAMKMVAAARLKRAQDRVQAARPYAGRMQDVMENLAGAAVATVQHPLLEQREVRNVGLLVVTADRGLAGSYNSAIIRRAVDLIDDMGRDRVRVYVIGRKGSTFLRRRGYNVVESLTINTSNLSFSEASAIARMLRHAFESAEIDEVHLLYTRFVTAITQQQEVMRLLPIEPPAASDQSPALDYLVEPGAEVLLGEMLPRYLVTQVYQALLESVASEHGARMTSMSSATDNAGKMISDLTLSLNRARQAGITKEISEIVGGAEALKG